MGRLASSTPQHPLYDVVLTDMLLPDGNGLSFVSFVQEKNLPIPVVVITGLGDEESAVSAIRTGASDYVVKRADYLSGLPAILESALHRYRTESARHSRPLHVLYGVHNISDAEMTGQHFSRYAPFITLDAAPTAEEVLKRLTPSPVDGEERGKVWDALLLDYHLPGMNGIEMLKELGEMPGLDIPIIIITGHGDEVIAAQSLRFGAADYVVKSAGYLHQLPWILENAHTRTEILREQKTLKAQEEYFRSLIENVSDIILVWDMETDGTVEYVSPSFERILGRRAEEIIGTNYGESRFVHPDDITLLAEATAKTALHPGCTGPTIELRLLHRDGSWHAMETVGRSLADPQGHIKIVTTMRDVTERRLTEETLNWKTALLEATLNSSLDGIMVVDGKRRGRISINQQAIDLWKIPDEVLERNDYEAQLKHSTGMTRYPDQFLEKVNYLYEHPNETCRDEIELNDGTIVDRYTAPVFGEDATYYGRIWTFHDITEQKHAERLLQESEQSLMAILAASPIGIGRVENKVIDWVNETLCHMSGYTAEELKGQEVRLFFPSSDVYARTVETLYESGHGEVRIKRKDGSLADSLIQISPLYGNAYVFTITDMTSQKEAENTLRFTQVCVDRAFDSVIWETIDGDIVYVNDATCSQTGYTREELLQMNIKNINPDFSPERWKKRWSLKKEGGALFFQSYHRAREGRIFPVEVASNYIEYEGKAYTCSIARDITERKSAEEALRQSEERYHTFIDSTSDMVFLKDDQYRHVIVNRQLAAFFGREEDDIIGKTDFDLMPPDPAARCRETDRAALQSSSVRIDMELNGDRVYESLKFPVKLSHNRVGIGGFIRDITDHKKAEAALQESEAKYRSVVENSLVGFYIIQDGLFRFVNKRFCEIHGYAEEEVVDRLDPIRNTVPEDREIVRKHIEGRISGLVPSVEYSVRVLRKDGQIITLKVVAGSSVYKGRPAVVGTLIDITREETLESQLRQAQKMEAIGTLAGGVAHDFNNILTVFTGYGTLLRMGMDEANPLQMYVDQILSASQKAANLTQSLLAFSRKQPISLAPVSINTVVQGTRKLLQRLLTEDIALKTVFCQDDTTVMADATQIDQILFNLATNARDAMPKGGVLIIETKVIELDNESAQLYGFNEAGKYVLLSVSDTGVGMSETTKEKIFEPFFTSKEVGKGTGLGLATVYGVVKQHGGHITVYSEINGGTTFRIYLPSVTIRPAAEQPPPPEIRPGHETILVAEDNDGVRQLITKMLTQYGYTVIEATDGDEAIRKFRNHSPIDLLILDSVMPKKNGREAYDEIIKTAPHIKVIFTSGYTRDIILDKGIEDRRFDFISKPLSPGELLRKVREVLDRP
jgi:two-component system cell cycle sensor histidine kinase/response regulator CckA